MLWKAAVPKYYYVLWFWRGKQNADKKLEKNTRQTKKAREKKNIKCSLTQCVVYIYLIRPSIRTQCLENDDIAFIQPFLLLLLLIFFNIVIVFHLFIHFSSHRCRRSCHRPCLLFCALYFFYFVFIFIFAGKQRHKREYLKDYFRRLAHERKNFLNKIQICLVYLYDS